MASVKLLIRPRKIKKNGEAYILVQIIHNQRSTEMSTGRSVLPSFWDQDKQKVIGNLPSKNALNAHLNGLKRDLESIMDLKLANRESFEAKDIIRLFRGEDPTLLVDFLKSYMTNNPDNIAETTLRNYQILLNKILDFDKTTSIKQLNHEWLEKFHKYLMSIHGNSLNTIHNRMKCLKRICKLAQQKGLVSKNPFEHYKLKTEPANRAYLTRDEINQLKNVKVKTYREALIRDTFIFGCFTGLRFSDLCLLKLESLHKENGTLRLYIQMEKTKDPLSFQLPTKAVQIIEQHGTFSIDSIFVFPISRQDKVGYQLKKEISSKNAYFNKVIKQVAQKAGIQKNISFHVARHTFATLSLSLGIPMEILSKLLGHADLKTTQIYGKIIDEHKDRAMQKWNNLM